MSKKAEVRRQEAEGGGRMEGLKVEDIKSKEQPKPSALCPLPSAFQGESLGKVSIIICAYNAEKYISHAIYSVLRQTYSNFELLIVNDGSTDKTLEIIKKWQLYNPRITYVTQSHQGQQIANQLAHEFVTGKLIGWLDADDILHPQCLEKCVPLFDLKNLQILYTQYYNTDESGLIKGLGHRCNIPYSKERLLFDFMTFHFRLYRRKLYDRIGGIDTSFKRAFDYDFCLRASEVTEFCYLEEPLYYYRQHPNSLSCTNRLLQQEYAAISINKAYQRRGINKRVEVKNNRIYIKT